MKLVKANFKKDDYKFSKSDGPFKNSLYVYICTYMKEKSVYKEISSINAAVLFTRFSFSSHARFLYSEISDEF